MMSAQTIRKALGLLQDDPDNEDAWGELREVLGFVSDHEPASLQDSDLNREELFELLGAALRAHEMRREHDAVAEILRLLAAIARGTDREPEYVAELARVYDEELLSEDAATRAFARLAEIAPGSTPAEDVLEKAQVKREKWKDLVARYVQEAKSAGDSSFKSSLLVRAAETSYRYGRLEGQGAAAQQEAQGPESQRSGKKKKKKKEANGGTNGGSHPHPLLDQIVNGLSEALQLDPRNRRAAMLLERIYREEGRFEDVASALESFATEAPAKDDKVAGFLRLARVLKKKLKAEERAVSVYERILDLAPGNQEATSALVEYFSAHEMWDHLVALYEEQLAGGGVRPGQEAGFILQIAMVHWRMRQRPDSAEPYFERLRRTEPAHPGMLEFFREQCKKRGDMQKLATVLADAQRSLADGPDKAKLGAEVAQLAEEGANAQKAIEQWRTVLRQDATNKDARDALKRLYRATGGFNALADLLRSELERVAPDDAAARLPILRDIAALYRDHIKSDSALVTVLSQITALDPNDAAAVRELVRVYDSLGRWRDLLTAQLKLAELETEPQMKADLYRQVARRWLEQFSNVQNAVEAYEKLREVMPDDPEATDKLKELYGKRRAFKPLYDLLEAEVTRMPAGEARRLTLIEMAKIAAERLEKGADAVRLYKQVLEEDPQAAGALDALEKQAERDKDFVTVAEVLEKRSEFAPDDATRLNLLQKLGAVYAERLRDAQGAMRTWKRVLELSPGHQKALRVLREAYVALGDYDGLTELYSSQRDFEGLVEVLSSAADKAQDPELKIALSYRAADVFEQHLNQPERAFRSYERVLSVRSDDKRAATKLVPIYEAEEKWARLPPLYDVLLKHAKTDEERVMLLKKLVSVYSEKLQDKVAAFSFARKAFALDPTRPGALADLESQARSSGDFGGFCETVGNRANDDRASASERRTLAVKLAQTFARELGRVDDAVTIYKQLIESDANEEEAMILLDGLLRAHDRRDDLRWLFRLRAERAKTAQKLEILGDWAVLEEEVLGSQESAISLYREMLSLVPHHGPALRALSRLLRSAGDAEGAAQVLEQDRDLREGTDKIAREIELARLYMTSLKKPNDALAAVKRVFELSPNEPEAIAVTEELMNVAETRARAAVILEATYARIGNYQRQADVLAVLIATAASKKDRLDLQLRLAEVYENLGQHGLAFDALIRASDDMPGELGLWDKLSVLASRTHRTQEFVDALARAVPTGGATELPPAVEMDLSERAATIFEDGLGDIDRALPYWERIFAHDPQNERAFTHLKQILSTREKWADLESLYERACAATTDIPRQTDLLTESALVAEELRGDKARAIGHYERILELQPDHEQASFALDKLYEQTERWDGLAKLLAKRLPNLGGEEAIELKVRLGAIHFNKLSQPKEALGYLEEVLVAEPTSRDAQLIVERCLDVPELRARAAQVLEGAYNERGESRELVRILEIRLEFAGDTIERRELLRRVAELRDEKLTDDPSAFEAYARLLPLAPQDNVARERLLEIAKRLGRQERAADVLTQAADAAEVPQPRAEILADVAKLYEGMGDNARAEAVYRRVLELDPEDAGLALPAARALERVYSAGGKNAELADVYRIQVKLEENVEERRVTLGRLGELCERVLGEPQRAIDAWKMRLEDDPGDESALSALDRLYEATGNHRSLVETLRARERGAQSPEIRRQLMTRIATTLADKLGDTEEAILAYRAVLDDFGAELSVLRALEKLYEAASRFGDLAETLEGELSLVDNPSEKIGIFARLGDVKRTRLGDTAGALEAFRQALSIDASHGPAREALERILDDADHRREAATILQPLYEAEGLDAPLLRVIDIEVEYAEGVDDRLKLLAQAATVAEGRLGDPTRAFAYASKGLRQAADGDQLSSWLERAERLAVVSRSENEHIALLAEVAPNILDEESQLGVTLRIAELARTRKGDAQMAIDYYKKALDLRADNPRALSALEELYGQANQAEDLRDILRRRADSAVSDADKKAILFKEARLVDEVQGNKRDAITIYEQILETGLDHDALAALERLYTAEGRWDDLVALYERELHGSGVSPTRKAELHQKLGSVFAEKLSEVERAFDEYEVALKIDSQHEATIDRLETLMRDKAHAGRAATILEGVYLVRLDWRKVMRTIEARLEVSEDPDDKRELLRRLAKLHEEQEENYRAALEVMAKLLTEDVTDETTWSELERLARVANAEGRLAEVYATELEKINSDEPATARLAFRTGEIFEAQKQMDRALTFYRRAYAFAPDESPQAFTAIDRLLKSEGKPKERIQLYREALDHKHEPEERIATLHVIAGLEENELNDADAAILTLRQAVDVDDSDAKALDALTRLYEKQERWADLGDLFRRRAEQSAMPDDEAKFRLALGKVQKDKLGQTESAIDEYQIIVDLDAPAALKQSAVRELEALVANERHRPRIVDILRPIYEKADDWKNLVRVNGERLAISKDAREQAAILRETAQLWETRGGDQWRAFIATKQAFVLDPEDFGTRQELDRLAELTSLWDELAESYEKALEKLEDHGKRELLEALAKLHDKRRDDPRKALDAYDRLFKLDETDPTPLDEMDQLATLLSDWPTLVRVLVKKAELAGNDEDRASTWRRIGEARRDMLDDAQGAIEAYERALELEPDSTFSLDCLISLYEAKNDAARLVDLYKRRVELAGEDDDDLKFRLLCDAADRYEVGLSDRREAVTLLEQAATLRPNDADVVSRLGRLFAAEKMWPELLANLRKSVELAQDDAQKRDLKRRIGDLLKKELEDPENALAAYREVLESGHDAHSVAEVREIGETRDELRGNAARILLPVLRSAGENAAYADALEMLVRAQTEPDERAQTLRTLAEVAEKDLGDVARSENALLRALAEVPHDESLHQTIERVAETTGREGWSRYADALAEKAASIFDAEVTSNLWKKIGRVASKHLADMPRAAEAFQKAAEQSGDNAEVLGLLEEAFAALGDTPALVDVLERRISITDDAAAQADLHHRLAVLALEKIGDKVRGLASLRTALERVPDHAASQRTLEGLLDDTDLFPDVAETLEGVYRTLGNATSLASIYERKVGRAQGQKERILARLQLAKVLENDARDPKAAQRAVEAALSENPTDLDVLGELERLAAQNGEFQGASDVLQRALETFDAAPGTLSTPNLAQLAEGGSAKLWVRLAEWRRDRLADTRGAEEALIKGTKADPDDIEIVKAIETLRRAPGRERDLVSTLRTRAKLETELPEKRALYKEARELCDSPISDAKLAEEVLRDLLAEDEADAWGLAELTELRKKAADWNEVVALLLKRADAAQEGEIARLKHEAAAVLTKELGKQDKAIELYKDLLDQDPADAQASEQLRALYESTSKFQELGKLLQKLIENAQSSDERAKLRLELSRLQSDKFDSPADAIDTLRAALEENPDESHAIVRLSELLEKTGQDAELADFLNTQIERARERQDVAGELSMMVRLGEVLEHRVKDAGRALKAYEDVLEREPSHKAALESVARLAESRDAWDRVASSLEKLLSMSNDENGVPIALRLANAKEKLGDVDGVEQALGRALELDAQNASVRDRLRALYEKRKKWAELAAMLVGDAELVRAKAGSVPPPAAAATASLAPPPPPAVAEEVKLLRQAATIHMKERNAPADAVPLLERASERVPQDRELLLVLCDAYTASARARDAANVLERIISSFGTKRTKELALYHHRLGRALIGLDVKDQALAQLDLAFKIDPGSVEVLRDLGTLSLETGDLDRAQKTFRALLLQKLDPASGIGKGEVFLRLGEISMKQGDKPKAIQMLERAIENDPQLTQAKTMLAELKK